MKRSLRYLRARRFERDLAAEMQAHLDEKIDESIAEGLAPQEARERALRHFGNRTQVAEACRGQWAFVSLDEICQDLRYAVRAMRRSPGFTTVAVLSLALGIGANTIVFSAVNQVLLRSLPYRESDRLFAVWSRSASHGTEPMHLSVADFYDWRTQSHAFESLTAYASWPMNLTNVEEAMDFAPDVRSAIRGVDKNQPVAEVGTLEEVLTRSTPMPRFTTAVIGIVSGLALLIAVIGCTDYWPTLLPNACRSSGSD